MIKFKKIKKGKLKKFKYKSNELKFGTIGLKAIESGILNSKQIEASKKAIAKKIKKRGKIWVIPHTNLPVTVKPTGMRMGKGKGSVSHWVTKIRGGSILFEICSGLNLKNSIEALKAGSGKLSVKTKIFK